MATTQFFGLTKWAHRWINNNCRHETYIEKVIREYPNGHVEVVSETICFLPIYTSKEKILGMFDEEVHSLSTYITDQGDEVEEYQLPSGSGTIFLQLRLKRTQEVIVASVCEEKELL